MSGEPQYGGGWNPSGGVPVVLAFTFSWLLNGGTMYCGRLSSNSIGNVPAGSVSETPSYGVCVVVRGSSWYVSGSTPVFFTVTRAVTVVPGVSVPLGIPLAVTRAPLKRTVPLSVACVSPEYTSSPGRKKRP